MTVKRKWHRPSRALNVMRAATIEINRPPLLELVNRVSIRLVRI